MSDARQIAERIWKEWAVNQQSEPLIDAITAALEAKERELAIAGQCLMEERDIYKAQLDKAVRLLAGCAHIGMFKSKEFGDEVNAFLNRVKGGKS